MASQLTSSTSASKPNVGEHSGSTAYLSAFQRIGPQIYFYHPTHDTSSDTSAANGTTPSTDSHTPRPDFIIICSWMAASSRHIAKYTNPYLTKYKDIPILLLRCSQRDVMFKSEGSQLDAMQPAATAVQSVFASLPGVPKVLVHVFSNGGSWSASLLASVYRQASGGLQLPVSALVLDSCPSYPNMSLSHRAISAALPKNPFVQMVSFVLIWVLLFTIRVINRLGITENLILKVRRVLNEPMGPFIKGGVPRVYICSKSDEMVPLDDVKRHSDDARGLMERMGLNEEEATRRVAFEEFVGSPHVGHLMVDKDRYWNVIKALWREAMKIQGAKDTQLKEWREKSLEGYQ